MIVTSLLQVRYSCIVFYLAFTDIYTTYTYIRVENTNDRDILFTTAVWVHPYTAAWAHPTLGTTPRRLSFSQRRHMRVGPVSPAHLRVCISGLSCTLTHRFSCILTHRFSCILTHRFSCILTPRLCLGSQSTGSAADSSSGFFSRSYVDGAPDNCR